ncbi:hypothetical protein IV102_20460 [bacterium]|nr:hypothetical protein [bacterium]
MDYLDSLQAEGQFHSRGRFTLDFAASRKRYEKLAFQDPAAFLRLWLQALLASGVGGLDLDASAQQLRLSWHGHPAPNWQALDLESVFGYLQGEQDHFQGDYLQYAKLACVLCSCRPDLRLTVQLPGCPWQLRLDSQGPQRLQEAGQQSQICLQQVGSRPLGRQVTLTTLDLLSPILSSSWPELHELKPQLAHFPAQVRLNGQLQVAIGGFNLDPSIPEILRVGVFHDDPRYNNILLPMGQPPKPLAWLQPVTILGLDWLGQVRPILHNRAYFVARIYLGDLNREDEVVEQRFQLKKHGFPLQISQGLIPKQAAVSIDASDLVTDISSKKPVVNQDLRSKVREARDWLARAAKLGLQHVKEAPRWQSFLQGSRHQSLTQLRRSAEKDCEAALQRLT